MYVYVCFADILTYILTYIYIIQQHNYSILANLKRETYTNLSKWFHKVDSTVLMIDAWSILSLRSLSPYRVPNPGHTKTRVKLCVLYLTLRGHSQSSTCFKCSLFQILFASGSVREKSQFLMAFLLLTVYNTYRYIQNL